MQSIKHSTKDCNTNLVVDVAREILTEDIKTNNNNYKKQKSYVNANIVNVNSKKIGNIVNIVQLYLPVFWQYVLNVR